MFDNIRTVESASRENPEKFAFDVKHIRTLRRRFSDRFRKTFLHSLRIMRVFYPIIPTRALWPRRVRETLKTFWRADKLPYLRARVRARAHTAYVLQSRGPAGADGERFRKLRVYRPLSCRTRADVCELSHDAERVARARSGNAGDFPFGNVCRLTSDELLVRVWRLPRVARVGRARPKRAIPGYGAPFPDRAQKSNTRHQ